MSNRLINDHQQEEEGKLKLLLDIVKYGGLFIIFLAGIFQVAQFIIWVAILIQRSLI
jgi:hypothetical protein